MCFFFFPHFHMPWTSRNNRCGFWEEISLLAACLFFFFFSCYFSCKVLHVSLIMSIMQNLRSLTISWILLALMVASKELTITMIIKLMMQLLLLKREKSTLAQILYTTDKFLYERNHAWFLSFKLWIFFSFFLFVVYIYFLLLLFFWVICYEHFWCNVTDVYESLLALSFLVRKYTYLLKNNNTV